MEDQANANNRKTNVIIVIIVNIEFKANKFS